MQRPQDDLRNGPDPIDGLRLALLQQRVEQLRARLRFRTFGLMEGLLLVLLIGGIALARGGGLGSYSRMQRLAVGLVLIIQAVGLWWSVRHSASKELQRLQLQIFAAAHSPDAAVVAEAATAARTLLLRKPR